ncbi:MAG: hypothetical protein BroJett033_7890 [Chloroflexota bacterium]|nr:MAG: hypothetical protein BroJett033_7890 [Chloroflexota bacterium]
MTFTYTPGAAPSDVTKVRYWIGDTDAAAALYSDEEIAMAISLEGTATRAVISLIRSAIAKLAQEPDVTADWLRVEWRRSSENWQMLLRQRQVEFGLGARAASGGQHAWRADSNQTAEPDWAAVMWP